MNLRFRQLGIPIAFVVVLFAAVFAEAADQRPRLVVLTDMGQDPDDLQSLIRLLVYSNEFDIEALIATGDNNHSHESSEIRDDLIHEAIDRYGRVVENLRKHDPRYPAPADLHGVVKRGNPYGGRKVEVFETIGKERDTEGSEWLLELFDADDRRPLNVTIWGGACDFAQALWKIQQTLPAREVDQILAGLRVFGINDQDSTNPWIRKQFPQLFHIHAQAREGDSFNSTYRGIFLGGDYSTLSRDWLYENVKQNHGSLGELYPDQTFTQRNPHGCIKEGDTPSWFYFLPNGLQNPEQPEYGGWGGRFGLRDTFYQDVKDTVGNETSYHATVWRWRPRFQNDFAARMDWCVKGFDDANHRPTAVCLGDNSQRFVHRAIKAGDSLTLTTDGSSDIDGDAIHAKWYVYPEVGTYGRDVAIENADQLSATITVPRDAAGKTIHIILELTDSGTPPLTSYRRTVLHVE